MIAPAGLTSSSWPRPIVRRGRMSSRQVCRIGGYLPVGGRGPALAARNRRRRGRRLPGFGSALIRSSRLGALGIVASRPDELVATGDRPVRDSGSGAWLAQTGAAAATQPDARRGDPGGAA